MNPLSDKKANEEYCKDFIRYINEKQLYSSKITVIDNDPIMTIHKLFPIKVINMILNQQDHISKIPLYINSPNSLIKETCIFCLNNPIS